MIIFKSKTQKDKLQVRPTSSLLWKGRRLHLGDAKKQNSAKRKQSEGLVHRMYPSRRWGTRIMMRSLVRRARSRNLTSILLLFWLETDSTQASSSNRRVDVLLNSNTSSTSFSFLFASRSSTFGGFTEQSTRHAIAGCPNPVHMVTHDPGR